ncbi:MAG: hypothetical protein ABL958_21145, partial [Bdellovibrionia bacterium]
MARNKRRHILSGAALAFGFCGLILLGGYMIRMEKYLSVQSIYLNHTGHVSIYKTGGLEKHLSAPLKYNLTQDDQNELLAALSAESEVEYVGKTLKGAGLVSNGCSSYPVLITAISRDFQIWARGHEMVRTHIPELSGVKHGDGFWVRPLETNPVNISPTLAALLDKTMVASEAPVAREPHLV